jgi:hypothetical protein
LTALAPFSPGAMADGPFVSISESASWQDNVTYAPKGDGIKGDLGFESGAQATWMQSLDFSTILLTSLSADVDASTSFSGLDNISVGTALKVRRKFGLGPLAPVVYAGLEGSACGYSDPERSKVEGDFVLGFAQRFDDELQLTLDGRLGSFDARDIVFSGNYASLDAALNWDVNETWRLKLIGGWRNGDLVSDYAAEKSPFGWISIDPKAEYLPGAWHYVGTFGSPYVAYRVGAVTWSYGAALSPAIGPHTSVSLRFEHYVSPGTDRYLDNVVTLSVAHRF